MINRREALKNTVLFGTASALSTSLFTLIQSCQAEERLSWEPQFLSPEHAQLVSALVDTILPSTDTPGGLDVKVDILIDLIYAKSLDENQQKQIVEAMNQFNDNCRSAYGNNFNKLSLANQVAILEAEEAKAPKFVRGVWGYAIEKQEPVGFYRGFKSLAIMGFCTSLEIGKHALNYDPIPGPYQGCISFAEVGKVWSL